MMAGLIHSVQSFMNAKETIIAKKKKKGERLDNGFIHHPEQGPHPKGLRWQEGRVVLRTILQLHSLEYSA